jgi:opacity protein-like surface antigen
MVKTFSALIVFSAAACAQPFGAGLKIGAPLTDALTIQSPNPFAYVSETHRYVVGGMVEFRLPKRLSVEVDALYRSFELRGTANSTSGASWEFPVLAKYKLLAGPVRPYVEGGLVLSHLSGLSDLVRVNHTSNYGITAGAGLEIHALVLRISPEIRYEGYAFPFFDTSAPGVSSGRNQALVMVGIGF